MSVEFLLTALVVVATPGTGVLYTLAAALARGPRAAVLKYAGVAYLLYMAVSTLRESGALAVQTDAAPRSARSVIVSGVLVNILNPKLTIFFLAFLPLFVPTGASDAVVRMLGLSAVFMLVTFVVFVVYGLFAAAVRARVVSRPRVMAWLRRIFAGAFVALGARLAVTDH